jgi:transposase
MPVISLSTTVSKYLEAAAKSDAAYDDIKAMPDEQLTVLFEGSEGSNIRKPPKQMPEMNYIHSELKRRGVTLQLLWEEYRMNHPEGYSRTQFCYYYNRWKKKLNPTMRMNHTAGKKVFVDFSGDKPLITDPLTGRKREVELFVGVSGASSYTFAIATDNQNIENWINCHIKMFDFFGGVPEAIVPDNLKSGIKDACYYEPEINPAYADMAAHYNVVILPARVRKPKDKAKVENGVLNVQRRILASLRNRIFFSLNDLNRAIAQELEKLNNRIMQHIDGSRSDLFSQSDKPAFKSLPDFPFELFSRQGKCGYRLSY